MFLDGGVWNRATLLNPALDLEFIDAGFHPSSALRTFFDDDSLAVTRYRVNQERDYLILAGHGLCDLPGWLVRIWR